MTSISNYFMGIDNGGTMCKAVIFNSFGDEIASASSKLELIKPQPGFTERDMNELWKINCMVIKQVINNSGLKADEIKGIACTGHGKGLYLWGKNEKPCYNGIVSTDSRAWKYPEKWDMDGTAIKVYKKTYQKILACQPVSLLCWLKDNKPDVLSGVKWIFEVKDYIRFKLTGQAYAELTDYSGTNLMNLKDKCFDPELLEYFGLSEFFDALPPIKNSTEFCGVVNKRASEETGLKEGTPLAGGMFDIDACAIAMDITNEDRICVIAGTWSINEYISKKPVLDKSVMMNSLYCIPGYYLIEECSPTSASNYEWFINIFLAEEKEQARKYGIDIYQYCNELVGKIEADEQNIIFLPYIFGSNYDPIAKATFVGFDSRHTRQHIIRAVLEGIVFCHMIHFEKLLANRTRTEAVRLAGGAANSLIWAQIFADVFRLPIEIVDTRELGTLGCAIAAAVAAGFYKDLREAAQNMVKIKCRIEPKSINSTVYEKKFDLYKKVSERLEGCWKSF